MIKASNIVRWLWNCLMLMGLLVLVACSEDNSDDITPQTDNLRLLSVTRANSPLVPDANSKIRLFITTENATTGDGGFNWNTGENKWDNDAAFVKENTQYYFYGYSPNDNSVVDKNNSGISATSADINGDYSKGADLTMSGLPVFTNQDILVIVGVQKAIVNADHTVDVPHVPATQGNYGFLSGLASENYVNLLMDHLYSQLKFQFCVDKDYYALRRIHLKEVTLKSSYVEKNAKVTATIRLRNTYGLVDHVGYSDAAATRPNQTEDFQVLKKGDADLGTKGYIDLPSVETPPIVLSKTVNCPHILFDTDGTYLSLVSKYDVYAADGTTRIREDQTAINKVKVSTLMTPGMLKTLTLTVTPTYLYVLADPDMDNPTIKIN